MSAILFIFFKAVLFVNAIDVWPDHCGFIPERGRCDNRKIVYFFNATSEKCQKFQHGQCKSLRNGFTTERKCLNECGDSVRLGQSSERCRYRSKTGPCKAGFRRYFYNRSSGRCDMFIYGGCQGNPNNFVRREDCQRICVDDDPVEIPETCFLLPEPGICKMHIPRYYFDYNSEDCYQFIYGGCGGNKNSFETKKDCLNKCDPSLLHSEGTSRCHYRPEKGSCDLNLKHYYYDVNRGHCLPFTYDGCDGNRNNFKTKGSCEKICKSGFNACSLKPDPGPCNRRSTRYYYNQKQRKCLPFTYGGCAGNHNNFETRVECLLKCSSARTGSDVTESTLDHHGRPSDHDETNNFYY